jgi:exodeoxyribonuclease V beta subunit
MGIAQAQGQDEARAEELRLTYVALTRAQSQVVAWWAPSWDEPNGGLSRLLRARVPGESSVPLRCSPPKIDCSEAMSSLKRWEDLGALVIEKSRVAPLAELRVESRPENLAVRHFHRDIDTATHIMLLIHHDGRGVCGVYPKDVAATKVELVLTAARREGHPLQCIMEAA